MPAETKSKPPTAPLPIATSGVTGAAAIPSGGRGETVAKVGTLVSAVVASSCCWLPLLLLAVGVSGAGMASALAAYRPLFIVVTFAFLGAAFYFTYRPKRAAAQAAGCSQPEADCCKTPEGGSKRRFNMLAFNKAMLWGVTVMAIVFLFFPGYVARVTGGGAAVAGDMQRSVLKVEGMTCEGCAPMAVRAIREAPEVLAVELDYSSGLATIGTNPAQPAPKEAILASLKSIGFDGQFIDP